MSENKLETKTKGEIAYDIISYLLDVQYKEWSEEKETEFKRETTERMVSVDALKQWILKLDGIYCLSEIATGEKCDRYDVNKVCSFEESNDCDFRCVRLEIREFLAKLEEGDKQK